MAIQIKLKNSVVQDSTPSTSDLPAVGEIALNANINSIGGFMRASDNSIVKIFGPGSLSTPTATTTVSGISELATNSETTTGTATNRVVTPAGLNAVTVAERTTSNTNYVAKAGSTLTGVLTMPNGSNSAPAINFGDSDSGIYAASGGNNVRIAVGGSDAISASTAGGINFSLAARALTSLTLGSQSATDKPLFFADANSVESSSLLLDNSSNEFRVRNNRFSGKIVFAPSSNVERARIDNGGKLLVGTSTARTNFFNAASTHTPRLQVESTSNDNGRAALGLIYGIANASGPYIVMAKHRSNTVGDNTVVVSGDETGIIAFQGADGSQFVDAARIQGFVDGTPGADDMPGRLEFSTTADGAASPTTRLTIDSAGLVKLPDNGKFVAGESSDLQIYHLGHSVIKNDNAAALLVVSDETHIVNNAISENLAKFINGGAVELYFDGSKKFETNSGGCTLTGTLTTTAGINAGNNISLDDNVKIKFGDNDDLQIYHDGNNFIKGSSGYINIAATANQTIFVDGGEIRMRSGDGGEILAKFIDDGSNELYYDNSKKFETTSTGVNCTAGLDVQGSTTLQNTFLSDNDKLNFGGGNDLQIYHDGSNSYISNSGTGNLYIADAEQIELRTGNFLVENANSTEILINSNVNGSVDLYYDNVARIATTTTGIRVDSRIAGMNDANTYVNIGTSSNDQFQFFTGGLDRLYLTGGPSDSGTVQIRGDNNFLQIGAGQDLDLHHNGTNSYIRNNTGNLHIRPLVAEEGIILKPNGAVELYYDNSKKLETHSAGVLVSGNVYLNDNNRFIAGTSNDLKIYHDGLNSYIEESGTGGLVLRTSTFALKNTANNENIISGFENGSVELYYDNSKKFETTSSGVSIPTDGTFLQIGAGQDLDLHHNGTNSFIRNKTGNLNIRPLVAEEGIILKPNGTVELYYDNSKKFETNSLGIGVGTSDTIIFNHSSSSDSNDNGVVLDGAGSIQVARHSEQCLLLNRQGTDGTIQTFYNDGTCVGFISVSGSTTGYSTNCSDRTLKKNFEDWTENALSLFKDLKPQKFNFITEEDTVDKTKGYVAQDLVDNFPEAYPKNDDGKYVFNPSGMVVYLMKAIQELEAKVATLEGA